MLEQLPEFIDQMLAKLRNVGIDTEGLELDHFASQASSLDDYENKKKEASIFSDLLEERQVGDVFVAFYKLNSAFLYNDFEISALEVISPYPGKYNESGLCHIEFVIPSFAEFAENYSELEISTKAMNREIFPKIKYDFRDGTDVRFHEENILNEL